MKQSFFKLPLIFAIAYWLINPIFSMLYSIINTSQESIILSDFIMDTLFNSLLYILPILLFILFISCIALYRYRIHTVTAKNIAFSIVLILILCIVIFAIYQFVFNPISMALFDGYNLTNKFSLLIYNIVMSFIYFLIVGIIIYYGIAVFNSYFDRTDPDLSILNNLTSPRIHLFLYTLLYVFVGLVSLELLSLYFYELYYNKMGQMIIYLLAVLISFVVIYFVVKSSFSYTFKTIELSRIIKSVFVSYLLSIIVNIIITIGLSLLVAALASDYYRNNSMISGLMLFGSILQLVVTCLIMRAVTRRYFSSFYVGYMDDSE